MFRFPLRRAKGFPEHSLAAAIKPLERKELKMITKLIAASLLLASSSLAFAAPPPGSCLGGCLPTAIAAPTPVFPVGYMCKSGWPNYAPVSCVNAADEDFLGAANNTHPEPKHHHKPL